MRSKGLGWLAGAVVLLLLLAVFSAAVPQAMGQSLNGAAAITPALKFTKVSRGQVAMTAAINADGTVAKCYLCKTTTTLHLGTGSYQVGFTSSVKASTGVARWVRADTLSTGSINTWCDTADRAGVASAIFVNCQNASGPVDTPFFLFIAK